MSHACSGFHTSAALTRRQMLRAGAAGMLGLSLPNLLRASSQYDGPKPKVRAKSVIFLFQWGGPSHLETFDMKPKADEKFRGPHKPMRSACADIEVNERLPQVAKIMDKVTVIRSVHHDMTNHNSAGYYALTGKRPPTDDQRLRESIDLFPGYGSVADRLLANKDPAMPAYVSYPHIIADGTATPGQFASFLGKQHDPLYVPADPNDPAFNLPQFSLPGGLSLDRLHHRRGLQQFLDSQSRMMDYSAEARGLDEYYQKALAMLNSSRVKDAFNIAAEPANIRDRYGRTTYGQGCLLARRLAESGVRFITCYFSQSIGGQSTTEGGWDTHGFNNTRMFPIVEKYHLPITEQTLPTLLLDLEQRGMLDETLVVWMGEFGRTPKINANISRDHWPHCYSVLLAGGGVKRGYVYGASDETGSKPAENPVTPDDIAATIHYLMGVDPRSEIIDSQGRPLMISSGNPILDVVA
ncbi:MAG TPA: DUF1501 domain-containing protein [Verrucomicrobiales bacterium]|jgi:hypothetical protein|nr:DUF1501 domain-containing protein [Verrucomicrobiales bacterium]